jgi:hypothetical protein
MLTRPFVLFCLLTAALVSASVALRAMEETRTQSDLDAFMEKVLARRDDNWKKLQQYVLEEKEGFDLTGPGGFPLWGMRREYAWFIRDGIFVRSPIIADGVKLSDEDRRKAEEQYLRRQRRREEAEKRRAEQRAKGEEVEEPSRYVVIGPQGVQTGTSDDHDKTLITNTDDLLKQVREPQFVSSAYFLKFKFEQGRYALAGREVLNGVNALKIEYYPGTGLFKEGRSKPDKRVKELSKEQQRERDEDAILESKMNKASMVTLWIDPSSHQILQYVFDDMDWDFFPGRSLVRIGDLQATMQMGQAFPNVWLPKSIEMRFEMMLAVGAVDAVYRVEYENYKEAAVTYKIK